MKSIIQILGLALVSCAAFFNPGYCQDTQFSQAYAAPLTLNPAMTGFFDGGYRLNLNHRRQWQSTVANPLTTSAFGGELRFENDKFTTSQYPDMFGVGILFFTDRVSVFDLNTNQIALSLAFHKSLHRKRLQYLSGGFNIGIQQRNVNYEDVSFGDQFNGIDAFDLATAERLPANNFGRGDMSLGLNYTAQTDKYTTFYAGVSFQHFLAPDNSFYQEETFIIAGQVINDPYHPRWVGHLSIDRSVSEVMSIIPRIIFTNQGPHTQLYAGALAEYRLINTVGTALQFGLMVKGVRDFEGSRVNQLISVIGIRFNQLSFGFSYDANLRNFSDGLNRPSNFEFSIRYIGDYDNDEDYCPSF